MSSLAVSGTRGHDAESDARLVVRVLSGESGCHAVLVARHQAALQERLRGLV